MSDTHMSGIYRCGTSPTMDTLVLGMDNSNMNGTWHIVQQLLSCRKTSTSEQHASITAQANSDVHEQNDLVLEVKQHRHLYTDVQIHEGTS